MATKTLNERLQELIQKSQGMIQAYTGSNYLFINCEEDKNISAYSFKFATPGGDELFILIPMTDLKLGFKNLVTKILRQVNKQKNYVEFFKLNK